MMITQSTREVEEIGTVGACRGMVNIACTRCTKAINTQYIEELWTLLLLLELAVIVAGEGDSCVKKKESTTAKFKGRESVQ
jgi:hypothetical protein